MLATLDHIQKNPELWWQMFWYAPDPSGDRACYGARALLIAGVKLRRMGWRTLIVADSVPEDVREKVVASLGRWPFEGMLPIATTARILLGLTDAQAVNLFDAANTLEDLERKVAEVLASGADRFVQREAKEVIPF
jgi:hypothetical protein